MQHLTGSGANSCMLTISMKLTGDGVAWVEEN
jgi:hypothetical protein